MRHIVHITGLWHHRLKTVKLFLEPICVRFRVAKSPFWGAQFISNADCFVEGYQLGINLILAAFPEHVEMLKQILTGADLGGNNQ